MSPTSPEATLTSLSLPGLSVTSRRPSGRKAIAHGWSRRATSALAKGTSGTRRGGWLPPVTRSTVAVATLAGLGALAVGVGGCSGVEAGSGIARPPAVMTGGFAS
jgi:hypothetical protein